MGQNYLIPLSGAVPSLHPSFMHHHHLAGHSLSLACQARLNSPLSNQSSLPHKHINTFRAWKVVRYISSPILRAHLILLSSDVAILSLLIRLVLLLETTCMHQWLRKSGMSIDKSLINQFLKACNLDIMYVYQAIAPLRRWPAFASPPICVLRSCKNCMNILVTTDSTCEMSNKCISPSTKRTTKRSSPISRQILIIQTGHFSCLLNIFYS